MTSNSSNNVATLQEFLAIENVKLTNAEEASALSCIRAQRFNDGFDVHNEVLTLYRRFFGNTNFLQMSGLVSAYHSLKEEIINKNLICLVFASINYQGSNNVLIDYYPTQQDTFINLTIRNISRCLYFTFINAGERDRLARLTPNFDMYYSAIVNRDGGGDENNQNT